MKLKTLTMSALLAVTAALSLFPEPSQKIVPYDNDIYTWIDLLYLDSGTICQTQTRPLSIAELDKLLELVDYQNLSPRGRDLYRKSETFLKRESSQEKHPEIKWQGSLSIETYADTNDEYTDWGYGFNDRRDFIHIQPEIFWGSRAYATTDIDILKERTTVSDPDTWTNSWGVWDAWDTKFPYRGFFSIGGPFWNIQAGRDVMTYGLGESGKLLLSDAAPFQDYIKLSSLWKDVHFTFSFHNFEPTDYDGNEYSETDSSRVDQKFMIGHKVEWKPVDKLRIGLAEMMLIGGEELQFRDLNPFNFFHNQLIGRYGDDYANSIAQLELEYTPVKGLRIYGNYVSDQAKTAYETERWPISDTDEPNAYGLQGGVQQSLTLEKGFLTSGLEYTVTSPWLYLEGDASYSVNSTYKVDGQTDAGDAIYTDPLGYALENDCNDLFFFLRYHVPEKYKVETSYSWIRKGELGIDDTLEYGEAAFEISAPSGTVETRHIWELSGAYKISKNWEVYAQIDNIWAQNYDNISSDWLYDLQTTAGFSYNW